MAVVWGGGALGDKFTVHVGKSMMWAGKPHFCGVYVSNHLGLCLV